jgi:hypothetical protein
VNENYDVIHSARDITSIFVSKKDPQTIQCLNECLDDDNLYSIRFTSGHRVREKFESHVICIDCNNSECTIGPMPLRENKPLDVKCKLCQFLYYRSDF